MASQGGRILIVEHGRLPLLTLAKAAARTLREIVPADLDLAGVCLDLQPYESKSVREFSQRLDALSRNDRNYWVGTLYTLMISPEARKAQAAYFTPPYLADAVIDMAVEHGFDLRRDDVLDPAAGGAAFLSLIAERMRAAGARPRDIAYRLNGIEIDPCLAQISESLIGTHTDGFGERKIVRVADALHTDPLASYKLVIANPPYGRITPQVLGGDDWRKVSHPGHVNKYAVFTEWCLRVAKPGGLVALVIPSSFRSGPLYDKMRAHIASQGQILTLGKLISRDDVFVDVAQDVSVLLVRKGEPHRPVLAAKFPSFTESGIVQPVPTGCLPADPSKPWLAPSDLADKIGGATLAEYGASAKAGYFVWNRERDKFCCADEPGAVPLIWAKNVRPGQPCVPTNRRGNGVDFVRVPEGSAALVKDHALVVQRTTNSSQNRRIVAAAVDKASVDPWKGFVSENHTIVVSGTDERQLNLLLMLLNTKAVDDRYRAVSGTATISVKLLRQLDLPRPIAFAAALKRVSDPERAALIAYEQGAGAISEAS
ncbi:N-6 DNA methylase [Ensifer sp. ENS07]|nr:N-6 DNA methylase [Ensifer sp. ENS10]MBD9637485.1 N-6 DNA methylase [Ensifer sp. ENS07]